MMSKSEKVKGRLGIIALAILVSMLFQSFGYNWGPVVSAQARASDDTFEYFVENTWFHDNAIDYAPNGQPIIVGNSGGVMKYDPAQDTFQVLRQDTGGNLNDVDHSTTGEALIVGEGGTALTIDTSYFKHEKTVPVVYGLNSVAWRHDGAYATVVGDSGALLNYTPMSPSLDQHNNTTVQGYDALGIASYSLICIDWAPDNSYALILSSNGIVFLFNGHNISWLANPPGPVSFLTLAISPDSSKALVGGHSGVLYTLNTETGEWVGLTVPDPSFSLESIAWKDANTAYVLGFKNGNTNAFFKYTGHAMLSDVTMHAEVNFPYCNDLAFDDKNLPASTGMCVGSGFLRYPNVPPAKISVWVVDKTKDTITVGYNQSNDKDFWKYEFYLSDTKGFTPGPATFSSNTTSKGTTQQMFMGLTKQQPYYFIVRVCDWSNLCTSSNELEAAPLDVTHPTPVTLTSTSVTLTSVTLEWSVFTDQFFAKYEVHKGDSAGFTINSSTLVNTYTWQSTHSTYVSSLMGATTYYFKVRVYNTDDYYSDSNELMVTTPMPPKPDAVTVAYAGLDSETAKPMLQWTVTKTSDFAKYEVHAATTPGFTITTETLFANPLTTKDNAGNINRYTLTMDSSEEGNRWYFKVRVVTNTGGYNDSNEVNLVYNQKPPTIDSPYTKGITSSSITVYWNKEFDKPNDFDYYQIEMREGTSGSFKSIAKVKDFTKSSYTASGLKPKTSYTFRVTMFDKLGYQGGGSSTTPVYTTTDATAEFFAGISDPSCMCSGGFILLIVIVSLISALGQKYKAQGVAWLIPMLVAVGIIAFVSFLNFVDEDLKIPTWWAPWVFGLCAMISAVIGIGTLIAIKGSYSARAGARSFAIAAAPALIMGLIVYLISFYNAAPGMRDISRSYFIWLIVLGIFISVGIAAARIGIAKARQARYAREEAQRAYERKVSEFNDKKKSINECLTKLENRAEVHKAKAPPAMINEVRRSLNEGRRAFDQAVNVDQAAYLDTAKTHTDNAEKVIVDIEAFVVAKEQAGSSLFNIKNRIMELKNRKAPRIENAMNLYKDADRRFEEAQTLPDVKSAMELVNRCIQACDESATSLKGAEEQLADLRTQLAQVSARYDELRSNPKELSNMSRVLPLLSKVTVIINDQSIKPDPGELALGRDAVRDARAIIQQVDERERQRQNLLSDIQRLSEEKADTATWSALDLSEIDANITKATTALDNDELGKAQSSVDEGFGQLDQLRTESAPKLSVVDRRYEMQVSKWEELVVELKNEGSATATDIDFNVDSPSAELQEIKDKAKFIFTVRPNDSVKVPLKIRFTEEGKVPIEITVTYRDNMDRDYSEQLPLDVDVLPKLLAPLPQAAKKPVDLGEAVIEVIKNKSYAQGLYKFKVGIQNNGKVGLRDVRFQLFYDPAQFKLVRSLPAERKRTGDVVDYGDIEPEMVTSVDFFLEAHMCTKTRLDGTISYRDWGGNIRSFQMDPFVETMACPPFADVDEPAVGQVKAKLDQEGWRQDTRTYAVPSTLDVNEAFDVMKQAIEGYDMNLRHITDECYNEPLMLEAWYYGKTKAEGKVGTGMEHVIIGRITQGPTTAKLELVGASMNMGQMFVVTSKIGNGIAEAIAKAANLRQPIQQIYQYMEIKDSVITGSNIGMDAGSGAVADGKSTGKVAIKDSVMVRSEVAGAKDVEVQGSVMQRTKLGSDHGPSCATDGPPRIVDQPKPTLDPMREFAYKVYRDTLRQVYEDGVVTTDERAILKRLRGQLGLSMEEHETLEEEIIAEREAKIAKGKKQ